MEDLSSNYRTEPISDFYVVKEELGRGSFSIVYKSVRKSDLKHYAVKVIDKIKLGSKKLEMIETEINLMKAVKGHPNIINLEEVFETLDEVHIVMEMITGGELFDKIIELQYYTENEASKVIRQVLSAVEHLHKNKIVHRDLKPENLLLSTSSIQADIKLADFGLSCFIGPKEKLTKAVGTPGYIAPEILQTLDEDLDGYGIEVDLWSIGVIMYIILCGFPPFYAEDDDEAFDQIIAGKFEYPDPYWTSISDSAKDLINHLLVVDAKKRYSVTQALSHPWIVSRQSDQHLDTTVEQLKKFNARRKWKKGMNAVRAMNKFKKLTLALSATSKKRVLESKFEKEKPTEKPSEEAKVGSPLVASSSRSQLSPVNFPSGSPDQSTIRLSPTFHASEDPPFLSKEIRPILSTSATNLQSHNPLVDFLPELITSHSTGSMFSGASPQAIRAIRSPSNDRKSPLTVVGGERRSPLTVIPDRASPTKQLDSPVVVRPKPVYASKGGTPMKASAGIPTKGVALPPIGSNAGVPLSPKASSPTKFHSIPSSPDKKSLLSSPSKTNRKPK